MTSGRVGGSCCLGVRGSRDAHGRLDQHALRPARRRLANVEGSMPMDVSPPGCPVSRSAVAGPIGRSSREGDRRMSVRAGCGRARTPFVRPAQGPPMADLGSSEWPSGPAASSSSGRASWSGEAPAASRSGGAGASGARWQGRCRRPLARHRPGPRLRRRRARPRSVCERSRAGDLSSG